MASRCIGYSGKGVTLIQKYIQYITARVLELLAAGFGCMLLFPGTMLRPLQG